MRRRRSLNSITVAVVTGALAATVSCEAPHSGVTDSGEAAPIQPPPEEVAPIVRTDPVAEDWRPLLSPGGLGGWKTAEFGGHGEPEVDGERLVLPMGEFLTGVVWTNEFPSLDYEIALDAMRVEGQDFFCGLTFPYRDTCASLILGGWGGRTCGISSLEGEDASSNETTDYIGFETERWYAVRLRVTGERIEAWVDERKIVDVATKDRVIDIRPEVDLCRPLGLASYQTTAALRRIRWRPASPESPAAE